MAATAHRRKDAAMAKRHDGVRPLPCGIDASEARSPLHAVGLACHLGAEVRATQAPLAGAAAAMPASTGDLPVIGPSPSHQARAVHG
ncbi:MAG: hypothetical protein H0X56_09675 [Solirubrobacterales bacterium]|nr:hypothetical protein [Solirubrobacterales bacterium]